jgi:hypothetical protein
MKHLIKEGQPSPYTVTLTVYRLWEFLHSGEVGRQMMCISNVQRAEAAVDERFCSDVFVCRRQRHLGHHVQEIDDAIADGNCGVECPPNAS